MLRRSGGSCSGRSKRRMPASSLGTSLAPVTSALVARAQRRLDGVVARRGRSRARTSRGRRSTSHAAELPAGRQRRDARHRRRRRHRLRHEDHHVARAARRRCRRSRGRAPASAGSPTSGTTTSAPRTSASVEARPASTLQRCSEIGRRSGASARNWASRSRPSCFITVRSWVGLATPRAAANASAISSGVK